MTGGWLLGPRPVAALPRCRCPNHAAATQIGRHCISAQFAAMNFRLCRNKFWAKSVSSISEMSAKKVGGGNFAGGGRQVCAWQGGRGRAAAAIPLALAPLHSLAPNQDGEGLPWTNSPFQPFCAISKPCPTVLPKHFYSFLSDTLQTRMTMGCHGSTHLFKSIICSRAWKGVASECSTSCRREQTRVQRRRTVRVRWGKGKRLPSELPLSTVFYSLSTSISLRSLRSTSRSRSSHLHPFLHELLPPRRGLHLRAGNDLHLPLVFLLHHHLLLLAVCQGVAPVLLPFAPCRLHPMAGASSLWEARERQEPNLGETATAELVELGLRRPTPKWWVEKYLLFFLLLFYRLSSHSIPQSLDSKVVSIATIWIQNAPRVWGSFACSSSRLVDPPVGAAVPVGPRSHLLANYSCQQTNLAPLPPLDSRTGPWQCVLLVPKKRGRRFCKRIAQYCKVVLQQLPSESADRGLGRCGPVGGQL